MKVKMFSLRTLEEAQSIALNLSFYFPKPEVVHFGIHELLINAIEHGNLDLGYDKKTELINNGTWEKEIEKRLDLPENRDKVVLVSCNKTNNAIELIIKDQGNGFNWQDYMEITPQRLMDNHGRGIAIASATSFDKMEYIGKGNEVKCIVNLNGKTTTE